MSGSVFSPTLQSNAVMKASRAVSRSLGCLNNELSHPDDTTLSLALSCIRQKSAEEVLRAFENTHRVSLSQTRATVLLK